MTKTCGECKHYKMKSKPLEMGICNSHENKGAFTFANSDACDCFKSRKRARVITNGDRIIAGGMRAIAEFAYKTTRTRICGMCAFATIENGRYVCNAKDDQSCIDGIEAWLNAPAESEVENVCIAEAIL